MTEAIRFQKPPVVEVVCGAAFGTLDAMKAPHIGLFWQMLPKKFSRVEEVTPIASAAFQDDGVALEFSNLPDLPRIWFIAEGERELIQLQRDRFLYNWKDERAAASYPEFDNIFPSFLGYLKNFEEFVSTEALGDLEYRQFELTYVNHIPVNSVESIVQRPCDVLVDHTRDISRPRFLPDPKSFRWITSYELPNDMGLLHITAQSAMVRETAEAVMRLDLTVRGATKDMSSNGMKSWFNVAHDWIVQGFCDVTDSQVQNKIWMRKS